MTGLAYCESVCRGEDEDVNAICGVTRCFGSYKPLSGFFIVMAAGFFLVIFSLCRKAFEKCKGSR